ncbi:hypothetical protein SEA_NAPOLEONB_49 [Arthrobacter phage NapoleonB]|uniref:Uncharacterized protein n=1 Tax=Arthrobacter phage Dynamite TaxID=2867479 RepID=A0AAE9BQZ3_9CAUD|nr:hypothetical protein PQB82_gp49 [Arthrobacter phage Dynamite]QFP95017.1 hypothetical protein SEA_NAPOLEONB_49 [Arthrobacter phage NapoleonB]UAW09210.1 hypothetical protein SEA_DYNAMITE_49 [Arthrobacter phage Dynamite]
MKYELAKLAVSAIVSTSTGMVVGNAVKATLPIGSSLIKKIGFGIGAVVIGEMVGNKASQYIDSQIDEFSEAMKMTRDGVRTAKDIFNDMKESPNEEGEKTEE